MDEWLERAATGRRRSFHPTLIPFIEEKYLGQNLVPAQKDVFLPWHKLCFSVLSRSKEAICGVPAWQSCCSSAGVCTASCLITPGSVLLLTVPSMARGTAPWCWARAAPEHCVALPSGTFCARWLIPLLWLLLFLLRKGADWSINGASCTEPCWAELPTLGSSAGCPCLSRWNTERSCSSVLFVLFCFCTRRPHHFWKDWESLHSPAAACELPDVPPRQREAVRAPAVCRTPVLGPCVLTVALLGFCLRLLGK